MLFAGFKGFGADSRDSALPSRLYPWVWGPSSRIPKGNMRGFPKIVVPFLGAPSPYSIWAVKGVPLFREIRMRAILGVPLRGTTLGGYKS